MGDFSLYKKVKFRSRNWHAVPLITGTLCSYRIHPGMGRTQVQDGHLNLHYLMLGSIETIEISYLASDAPLVLVLSFGKNRCVLYTGGYGMSRSWVSQGGKWDSSSVPKTHLRSTRPSVCPSDSSKSRIKVRGQSSQVSSSKVEYPWRAFHIGWRAGISGLTSTFSPLGSMLNFDADVKKTTARHQCENPCTRNWHAATKLSEENHFAQGRASCPASPWNRWTVTSGREWLSPWCRTLISICWSVPTAWQQFGLHSWFVQLYHCEPESCCPESSHQSVNTQSTGTDTITTQPTSLSWKIVHINAQRLFWATSKYNGRVRGMSWIFCLQQTTPGLRTLSLQVRFRLHSLKFCDWLFGCVGFT